MPSSIWAIADLHLAFSVPEKSMDAFGEPWVHYTQKIEQHWRANIQPSDLVLIPGDISWAMRPEEAQIDLQWIDQLPGTKLLLRGNHDYWWPSLTKLQKILPPSVHVIQNNTFEWENIQIGGTRLWDTSEYSFGQYTEFKENPRTNALLEHQVDEEAEKIFQRELIRLELSLQGLKQGSSYRRIAMTHYPPIGANLQESRTSLLLEKYHIDDCVFGHLHSIKAGSLPFGEKNGIRYSLTSCDYLNFNPLKIT